MGREIRPDAHRLTAVEDAQCRPSSSKRWTPPANEVKDSIEATNEEEAQQKIKQMGYFVTKLTAVAGGKAARARRRRRPAQEVQQDVHHRRRHAARCWCTFTRQFSTLQDAGLPVLRGAAHPRTADEAVRAQELAHRRGRRRRVAASTLSEALGQAPEVLRPALREHGQGRRGRRCPRSHPPAPGRLQGKGPDASSARSSARWSTRPSSSSSPSAS